MKNKILYILRHAETESGLNKQDKDRVLTESGQKRARDLVSVVGDNGHVPDMVLCSTAMRTRQTAEPLITDRNCPVRYMDDMYMASAGQLYHIVRSIDDNQLSHVLVVAHNPGIHQLANFLARPADVDMHDGLRYAYPAGTLTILQTDEGNWNDIQPGSMTVRDVLYP